MEYGLGIMSTWQRMDSRRDDPLENSRQRLAIPLRVQRNRRVGCRSLHLALLTSNGAIALVPG